MPQKTFYRGRLYTGFCSGYRRCTPFVVWTALIGVCGCLIGGTLADVPQWKNDGTLMQAEIRYDRNFVPAKTGEAYLYDMQGKNEEAIASYDQAVHQLLPEARTIDDVIRAASGSRYAAPDGQREQSALQRCSLSCHLDYGAGRSETAAWTVGRSRRRLPRRSRPEPERQHDGRLAGVCLRPCGQPGSGRSRSESADRPPRRLVPAGADWATCTFGRGAGHLARDTLACAFAAPPSDTGSVVDIALARQQYDEAFAPRPSHARQTQVT